MDAGRFNDAEHVIDAWAIDFKLNRETRLVITTRVMTAMTYRLPRSDFTKMQMEKFHDCVSTGKREVKYLQVLQIFWLSKLTLLF